MTVVGLQLLELGFNDTGGLRGTFQRILWLWGLLVSLDVSISQWLGLRLSLSTVSAHSGSEDRSSQEVLSQVDS